MKEFHCVLAGGLVGDAENHFGCLRLSRAFRLVHAGDEVKGQGNREEPLIRKACARSCLDAREQTPDVRLRRSGAAATERGGKAMTAPADHDLLPAPRGAGASYGRPTRWRLERAGWGDSGLTEELDRLSTAAPHSAPVERREPRSVDPPPWASKHSVADHRGVTLSRRWWYPCSSEAFCVG